VESVDSDPKTKPERAARDLDSHVPHRTAGGSSRRFLSAGLRARLERPERRAFLGVLILALALFVLFPSGVSIQSSDSAVVVNTAALVADIDHGWLLKSQEPPLLQAVYGPWLGVLDDTQPLVLIPLGSTILLAALTAALAGRLTRSALVGLFGGLVLLAMGTPVAQSRLLPLYAGFIAFGMLGVWKAIGFIREERVSYWRAVAAAVWTLLAVVAHGAGLYFLTLVLATVLFVGDRRSLRRYIELLGILLVVFLPWIVAHLWIGGFDRFPSPRSTWVTSQGYLARVTLDYWHQAVENPRDALTLLPQELVRAMGWAAWLVVPLGIVGVIKLSTRAKVFVVVAALGLVAPMILYQTRVFARYFYPLLPGLAILAALGLSIVIGYMRSSLPRFAVPVVTGVLIAGVAAGFVANLADAINVASAERESPERTDLVRVASLIEDDRAVIAPRRSTVLMLEAPDVFVYYADVLTEEEFVSYLTWQRDKIEQTLLRRNIGWALVRKPAQREVLYNATWLEPAYGVKPTYAEEIKKDPMSCLAYDGAKFRLYRLRPAGDAGAGGTCN
jgi:hypothetical protein